MLGNGTGREVQAEAAVAEMFTRDNLVEIKRANATIARIVIEAQSVSARHAMMQDGASDNVFADVGMTLILLSDDKDKVQAGDALLINGERWKVLTEDDLSFFKNQIIAFLAQPEEMKPAATVPVYVDSETGEFHILH